MTNCQGHVITQASRDYMLDFAFLILSSISKCRFGFRLPSSSRLSNQPPLAHSRLSFIASLPFPFAAVQKLGYLSPSRSGAMIDDIFTPAQIAGRHTSY
jgi:hypothetical protein